MSGTGLTFTGVIGCGGALFPTEHACTGGTHVPSGATATVNLGAPTGMNVGDLMVACVGGGSYLNGSPWTFTPDPAWTAVYEEDLSDTWVVGNLYYKIADQDDEDGTASYSWSLSVSGGASGLRVIHAGWPRQFGTTIGDASMTRSDAPSLPSPGGGWQLAFVYQRSGSNFAQPSPDPVVTSTATLLCEGVSSSSTGYRAGNMRVYASDNVDPITGAYLQGGISFNRNALVVAAVSA